MHTCVFSMTTLRVLTCARLKWESGTSGQSRKIQDCPSSSFFAGGSRSAHAPTLVWSLFYIFSRTFVRTIVCARWARFSSMYVAPGLGSLQVIVLSLWPGPHSGPLDWTTDTALVTAWGRSSVFTKVTTHTHFTQPHTVYIH